MLKYVYKFDLWQLNNQLEGSWNFQSISILQSEFSFLFNHQSFQDPHIPHRTAFPPSNKAPPPILVPLKLLWERQEIGWGLNFRASCRTIRWESSSENTAHLTQVLQLSQKLPCTGHKLKGHIKDYATNRLVCESFHTSILGQNTASISLA